MVNLNSKIGNSNNMTYTGLLPSELETESSLDSKFAFSMFGYGVLILATLFYFMKWDKYSFEVIPLKLAYLLGTANSEQLSRLAVICEDRNSYSCGVDSLKSLTDISPSTENFKRLGDLYGQSANHPKAIESYKLALSHYSLAGLSNTLLLRDLHYELAKNYEALGQNNAALQSYKESIHSRPNAIQVSVIKAYSKLLKTMGKDTISDSLMRKAREELGIGSSASDIL